MFSVYLMGRTEDGNSETGDEYFYRISVSEPQDKLKKTFVTRYRYLKTTNFLTKEEFEDIVDSLMVKTNYNFDLTVKELKEGYGFEDLAIISHKHFDIQKIKSESNNLEDFLTTIRIK